MPQAVGSSLFGGESDGPEILATAVLLGSKAKFMLTLSTYEIILFNITDKGKYVPPKLYI